MGRVTDIGVVVVAIGRTDIACVILPGTGANDMGAAVASGPDRAVGRRPLVIPVPAILDPLIDPAAHVVQAERIGPGTADLDRLVGGGVTAAILATGIARLQLVTPPVFRLRSAA